MTVNFNSQALLPRFVYWPKNNGLKYSLLIRIPPESKSGINFVFFLNLKFFILFFRARSGMPLNARKSRKTPNPGTSKRELSLACLSFLWIPFRRLYSQQPLLSFFCLLFFGFCSSGVFKSKYGDWDLLWILMDQDISCSPNHHFQTVFSTEFQPLD